MKLQIGLLILVGACVLGGCQSRTLSAEDFLYVYRCGNLPGEPSGTGGSSYQGKDQTYHYVFTRPSTPTEKFFLQDTNGRKFRCRVDQLPKDFPEGFEPLKGDTGFEAQDDTHQYVQHYLEEHKMKGPAPRKDVEGEGSQ